MTMGFILREGLTGFKKARMPFMSGVVTIMLATLMIGTAILAGDNALIFIKNLQAEFDIEIFFQANTPSEKIQITAEYIANHNSVSAFQYVSSDDAANIFKEEFGEDIYIILDYNPLPASIRVSFKEEYRYLHHVNQIIDSVTALGYIENISFKKDLFLRLQKTLNLFMLASGGVVVLLILGAVMVTANMSRLIILARFDFIETMRLIGASDSIIKAPFLLDGSLQGFIGGSLAIGAIYGLFQLVVHNLGSEIILSDIINQPILMIGLIAFAVILGILGSYRAARRFVKLVI
jgi:cell division transport system permease protein